jgi:exodeoxyribonuclease VII large subunit
MVACIHVKTPTALADLLVDMYADEDARLISCQNRMRLAFSSRLAAEDARLDMLRTRIVAADPRKILGRGYVLAVNEEGVVLKSASGCRPGDKVALMFADGTLHGTVDRVEVAAPGRK